MKPFLNIIVLLCALFVAVAAYHEKNKNNITRLDEIKAALMPLTALKDAGTTVDCLASVDDPEMMCWLINAMAPANIIPALKGQDTTLFVFKPDANDSLITSSIQNKDKLWEARSAHYYFILGKTRN